MTTSPLATMSKAARELLAASSAYPDTPWQADTIIEMREETLKAYIPASQWAVQHYNVEYKDTEIGGITCMQVQPVSGITDNRQILYIFGGGFMLGSPFEDLPITAALAAKTGARIIVPYYRLAPEHPFPAALDDVTVVATVLLSTNSRTVLAGESAGGNLALALIHRLRSTKAAVPPAIAALSPATVFDRSGDSRQADRDPFLRAARIDDVRDAYLAGADPQNPQISPLYGAFDSAFPPTMVTTGTRDLLLSDCVRLARVMRESGALIDLRIWDGMWHVFEFYPELPEAQASLDDIANFLIPYFTAD